MKKLFAILVVIAFVASVASAQSFWGQAKMSAGVGAEVALPTVSGNGPGMGIGGFGLFQYGLNEDMLLTGQVGYTSFMEKDYSGAKASMSALTILAGGKYNLGKAVTPGFYGMLQLGIYAASFKVSIPSYTIPGYGTIGGGTGTTSKSEFVFAPGVGMQFGNIDASVKYIINSDVSNIALNVAYVMPL